jgi:hypothetical protein
MLPSGFERGSMTGEKETARSPWGDQVDRILLLESMEAGPNTHMRMNASLDGTRSVLPDLNGKCVLYMV